MATQRPRGELDGVPTIPIRTSAANYVYIDMDDCMHQALDPAEGEVLPVLRRSAPAG